MFTITPRGGNFIAILTEPGEAIWGTEKLIVTKICKNGWNGQLTLSGKKNDGTTKIVPYRDVNEPSENVLAAVKELRKPYPKTPPAPNKAWEDIQLERNFCYSA